MAAATRTVSRSSRHYAFPAAPSPSRALFPPDGDATIWRLWCPAIGELIRRLLPPPPAPPRCYEPPPARPPPPGACLRRRGPRPPPPPPPPGGGRGRGESGGRGD